MIDVKSNIANNIVELRKSKKWTQAELAEKLNYTDKAVSKWERGESTPDVEILYQMSLLFGVTIDYFFHEDSSMNITRYTLPKKQMQRKFLQLGLVLTSVFFVSIVIFVYGHIRNASHSKDLWISFVWAVPICSLITTLFFRKINYTKGVPIAGSILLWSFLISSYLQCLVLGENVWLIFLIGLPIQIAIIIGYWLKK